MKKVLFKVSAIAMRLIGLKNVATSQGAVTELVKNANDADACTCAIYFLHRHSETPKTLSTEEFSSLSNVLKAATRFT
ncbi:MAG: hypothetical protein OXC62_15060 [Aestuariivita sp.]|nr:hypothetical protein [Aestuariivita sp.]